MGNAARKSKTQKHTETPQCNSTTPRSYTITPSQQIQAQLIQQHQPYQQPAVQAQNSLAVAQHMLYYPIQRGPATDSGSIDCLQFHIPKHGGDSAPQPSSSNLSINPSLHDLDEIDDIEAVCQPMRLQRPSLTTVRSDPQPTRLERILENSHFINPVTYPIQDSMDPTLGSINARSDSSLPLQSRSFERPSTPVLSSATKTLRSNPGGMCSTEYVYPSVTFEGQFTPSDSFDVNRSLSSCNKGVPISSFQRYGLPHEENISAICLVTPSNGNVSVTSQEPSGLDIETLTESRQHDISEENSYPIYGPVKEPILTYPTIVPGASPLRESSVNGYDLQSLNNVSGFICTDHLKEQCIEKCLLNHRQNQYQWQFRTSEKGWEDFSDNSNEATERRFCCPAKEYCFIPFQNEGLVKVNLDEMSVSGFKVPMRVRRLTTLSTESPDMTSDMLAYLTIWLWYWEDSPNHWVQFGQKKRKGHNPSADSIKIERAYQETPNGSTVMSVKKAKYRLYFSAWQKEHLKDKRRVRIRRRPLFNQPH